MRKPAGRTVAFVATLGVIGALAVGVGSADARGLIHGNEIANATITGQNIAGNTIDGGKIEANSVGWSELDPGVVRDIVKGATPAAGAVGKAGPQGPQGLPGKDGTNGTNGVSITGPQGPAGADGVVGNILHNSHTVTVSAGARGVDVDVTCAGDTGYGDATGNGAATGYVAVGGGFNVKYPDPSTQVIQSRNMISLPSATDPYSYNGKGWIVTVNNTGSTDQIVQAYVVCIYAPNDDSTD